MHWRVESAAEKMAEVLCVYRQVKILKKAAVSKSRPSDAVAVVSYDEKPGIQAIATTRLHWRERADRTLFGSLSLPSVRDRKIRCRPLGLDWRPKVPPVPPKEDCTESSECHSCGCPRRQRGRPFRTALSAVGTNVPTGAKMIAQSSASGGASSDEPAQHAPSLRAKS